MDNEKIKVGDEVNVFWERDTLWNVTVVHIPQATGDSWILKDNEMVHYVQIFCRMDKIVDLKEDILQLPQEDKAAFLVDLLNAVQVSIKDCNFVAIKDCLEDWDATIELLHIPGMRERICKCFEELKKKRAVELCKCFEELKACGKIKQKEKEDDIVVDYDKNADVLYITLGKLREGVAFEKKDGDFIRVDPSTNEVIGMTIIDFKRKYIKEV